MKNLNKSMLSREREREKERKKTMVIDVKKEVRKIKKELEKGLTILTVFPSIKHVEDFVENVAKNYKKVCYVSFSKPYNSFVKHPEINKISLNKFFFIDCITKSVIKRPEKVKNCIFVSSPTAFTEIKETIRKVLQKKSFDILIFDSLSSLLIYEKEAFVTRFLHGLIAMIKSIGCKSVFIILEKDVERNVVKNLGMLTDKTLWLK